MTTIAPRTVAYAGLWLLLALVIVARRLPDAPVELHPGTVTAPFRIHLNDDPWERIALIEGIGETLARRIVDARNERGTFQSLDEVKALPGVPDRALDRAAAWLTLERIDPRMESATSGRLTPQGEPVEQIVPSGGRGG